jgi:hypothetical protein
MAVILSLSACFLFAVLLIYLYFTTYARDGGLVYGTWDIARIG